MSIGTDLDSGGYKSAFLLWCKCQIIDKNLRLFFQLEIFILKTYLSSSLPFFLLLLCFISFVVACESNIRKCRYEIIRDSSFTTDALKDGFLAGPASLLPKDMNDIAFSHPARHVPSLSQSEFSAFKRKTITSNQSATIDM